MGRGFQWWPDQASSFAPKTDALYTFLLAVAAFFTLLIFVLIVYFALRYRRRPGRIAVPIKTSFALELDLLDAVLQRLLDLHPRLPG